MGSMSRCCDLAQQQQQQQQKKKQQQSFFCCVDSFSLFELVFVLLRRIESKD
jgi:hypothetical protein